MKFHLAVAKIRRLSLVAALPTFILAACAPLSSALGGDTAGRLVILPDGRHINLRCQGKGSPTVLFESGFGANASAWVKVQPAVARETRVCSYDRAGAGFSDPGPLPRDGAAIARDLDETLRAADIQGPFVVVGHSAGGLYARLFAARRPGEVKGLVLLDPTIEQRLAPGTPLPLQGIRDRLQRCLSAAEAAAAFDDPRWSGCLPKDASKHDRTAAAKAATWRNQISELDSIFTRTSEEVFRIGGLLRDIPVYIITASETAARSSAPLYGDGQSMWEFQHQLLADSFQHGSRETVFSSHLVMIDRPDVAIAATHEMVAAARAGDAPPPLPGDETSILSQDGSDAASVPPH